MFRVWNWVFIQIRVSAGIASRILKEVAVHAKSTFHACKWSYAHARNGRSCRSSGQWGTAALSASAASAYPYAASIDQEFARLTKDLELTPKQQQQVRPLLEEHHDKIQALLDKNPKASRQKLSPQIHAISDETHSKIHALLTDLQKELEKAMQQREHNGEENRRSAPPAASKGPSS